MENLNETGLNPSAYDRIYNGFGSMATAVSTLLLAMIYGGPDQPTLYVLSLLVVAALMFVAAIYVGMTGKGYYSYALRSFPHRRKNRVSITWSFIFLVLIGLSLIIPSEIAETMSVVFYLATFAIFAVALYRR